MKIVKADVIALEYAIGILDLVCKQTISAEQTGLLRNNIARLRKIRIAIVIGLFTGLLNFESLCQDGIPESNPTLIAFKKLWHDVDIESQPALR